MLPAARQALRAASAAYSDLRALNTALYGKESKLHARETRREAAREKRGERVEARKAAAAEEGRERGAHNAGARRNKLALKDWEL